MAETYLIGYGTLLHRDSLGSSIGQHAAREKVVVPIVVSGFKRVFNLRPAHYISITSNKLGREGIENAAMNLEAAPESTFNGLAIPSTKEEIRALDNRERHYERIAVPLHEFGTGRDIGVGYVYAALSDSPFVDHRPEKLMPLWRDVVWARSGAYSISPEFGEYFDDTTYLADGQRLVIDVYRELLRDTSDVPPPPVRRL